MQRKAIFLDRDGVINETIFKMGKPRAPYTLDEFKFCDGVEKAVAKLKECGFLIIVVTNQPDVARGWVERNAVDMVNDLVVKTLKVDDLKVCFHTEKDGCHCRKPKPGMLLEAASEFAIDLKSSFMVGDRSSDIEAGKSAGCKTIFIGTPSESDDVTADFCSPGLLGSVSWITSH